MPKRQTSKPEVVVDSYDRRVLLEGELRQAVYDLFGVTIAEERVCHDHHSPWEFFRDIHLDRPALALVLGPRGGGKSFLAALDTHLRSRWSPGYATRILGGSKAQSMQVYQALRDLVYRGKEMEVVERLMRDGGRYKNGSEIAILAASSKSVRGPHVPSLKLDEVDEIESECREAAMGMCMNRGSEPASVVMTSTWHRVGGPMSELVERGSRGEFPYYRFCSFEILERCPEERSGRNLERCPECMLVEWCHEDRDRHPRRLPKAKRSNGHYSIDALIQKARSTSRRTFEADYLCKGPRADGLWFSECDTSALTSEGAEYDPSLPVHIAVDPGVVTGAVYFQLVRRVVANGTGVEEMVHVFGDYLAESVAAELNAVAIVDRAMKRCGGRIEVVWIDPAGTTRNAIGPTVVAEFERGGLRGMRPWPRGTVADGLALIESFMHPADGIPRLRIHPRCTNLLSALRHYRRARRSGQWQDYPEDPQHPHEDLVDALRGGLKGLYPEGRKTLTTLTRVAARQVF